MSESTEAELRQKVLELLRQSSVPAWVWAALRHYYDTGDFRPEDLNRILEAPFSPAGRSEV